MTPKPMELRTTWACHVHSIYQKSNCEIHIDDDGNDSDHTVSLHTRTKKERVYTKVPTIESQREDSQIYLPTHEIVVKSMEKS
jgi:hypothetical protein